MSWPRVSTRPALRSRYSSKSNSFSGMEMGSPSTQTVWRSTSMLTRPPRKMSLDGSGATASEVSAPPRRNTARMRAMSSREEYGLVT